MPSFIKDYVLSDFVLGGMGSVGATFFTNPIEVIKTRIQLQGELAKRGTYVEPYKGVLHALITVAKHDGLAGLQGGLLPALYFQFLINAIRLSIYRTAIDNGWIYRKNGEMSFTLGYFWGACGGVLGSLMSSPLFMVKTQLQAQAAKQIAVGYQHEHEGMLHAFRKTYSQHGVTGLWRGATAALPRAAIGSGAQISVFGPTKEILHDRGWVVQPALNSFAAGVVAGSFMSVAMTPPDVITTRLYNQGVDSQGRGLQYNGWFDCAVKIVRTEGLYGLYKGFWPHYLRLAPHSTLVLLFFDELMALRNRYFAPS